MFVLISVFVLLAFVVCTIFLKQEIGKNIKLGGDEGRKIWEELGEQENVIKIYHMKKNVSIKTTIKLESFRLTLSE